MLMSEPVTTVDARFSNKGAVATPWSVTRESIESAQLFWIATVRADGRPHVTPLVAVWSGEALYFSTGADEQKALNISQHAHVILSTGCNEGEGGFEVVV